ncbi:MAG: SH3 domain-containing protein [Gammaproteobacteria bacterium]|nr:SH3 domain-containing protein [Gammaproteobacteria bacterium]MBU1556100.1 SH3 domain-containing protein [Gammaproteobacteria bacterium]MBU2072442.1 SH3 domain-containing protein [Gammaproteobacteria bacterium]MBU2182570.1 SH3 domain-containing protein [Gammaproteobacteria bacterium]MBU2203980.1 SH3 domain-containing protein [Gammaproteobacteria bacterium]
MLKTLGLLCCISSLLVEAAVLPFSSDVPLLTAEHLHSHYWLTSNKHDQLLLNPQQITERNSQTFKLQPELQALQNLPAILSKAELADKIQRVSAKAGTSRFYADGTELNDSDWQRYQALLALDTLQPANAVQFGLVVKRTALRAFPTLDRVFNQQMNTDLDRFSETALFPAEPVAVLHKSRDANWLLVQSYNYSGWVLSRDIAIGDRQQILAYSQREPFLVVTGAKISTAFNPEISAISELQLEMGVRLPLLSAADTGHKLYGQNPAASYIVQLPQRLHDGSLSLIPALIPRSSDVSTGYLAFTERNIVGQAFKFLGERYGWGHDYNGRDCTGFISEIFRSFGLLMPRNSGQQGNGSFGRNTRFTADGSPSDKLAALAQLQIGDLLYFPGHVALYLGHSNNEVFMIHDVNTLIYPVQSGMYHGSLNGVAVTPLQPLYANAQQSYLQALYAIKSLR